MSRKTDRLKQKHKNHVLRNRLEGDMNALRYEMETRQARNDDAIREVIKSNREALDRIHSCIDRHNETMKIHSRDFTTMLATQHAEHKQSMAEHDEKLTRKVLTLAGSILGIIAGIFAIFKFSGLL